MLLDLSVMINFIVKIFPTFFSVERKLMKVNLAHDSLPAASKHAVRRYALHIATNHTPPTYLPTDRSSVRWRVARW